ncbi:Uma2 family endonuclease [Thiorhodovibrio frisius]|uniref:Putative restriction endonuclease domain-containing protein n=1 Tax=Thiorhodovibrio frisius TaxID=631362 RepID=H8Z044_9GAMM|nr:Uma2 family endonuclease [Thiorhodovibrio frisius]EIC21217.1 hypothetical protein Thi970DRAFT_01406 [Thiorhodovibrio frisius]WPL23793.1 hypothetical protein Thiofri_03996 [Thiorhodovibrio frisius]
MQPLEKQSLSFEEWLEAERASLEGKTEYFGGEVFAMAGGSEAHNLIAGNVHAELRASFKGRPCYAYTSDMKVWIASVELGAYPDAMVICGEREFRDGRRDVVTNPSLIVEVLSDSTELYDRGKKFEHYRKLPSLQGYLLLSQQQVSAELFQRDGDGRWFLRDYNQLDQSIDLPWLDVSLPLSEVYDKVEFIPVAKTDGVADV